jgi:predicted component of type VI protein secretion system
LNFDDQAVRRSIRRFDRAALQLYCSLGNCKTYTESPISRRSRSVKPVKRTKYTLTLNEGNQPIAVLAYVADSSPAIV